MLGPDSIFAGDYRIERSLAEGGMGAVYVAEQISTGQKRALKVMLPQLVPDERSRQRFLDEARIGSRIDSEHVVSVVAAGIDAQSGVPWLAMELLDGTNLDEHVRREGPRPPGEVVELLDQVAHALGDAHRKGIIHRDLKPENLFLTRSRRRGSEMIVKILDFGIARTIAESRNAATVTSAIGSPMWMAPEQAQPGARLTPATDVWALGLITFYLLTGRCYWLAANGPSFNLQALLVEVVAQPIPPASERAAQLGLAGPSSPRFDEWLMRCLDRDPARRFAEATQAVAALRAALAGDAGATPVGVVPTQPISVTSMPSWSESTSTPGLAAAPVPARGMSTPAAAPRPAVSPVPATTSWESQGAPQLPERASKKVGLVVGLVAGLLALGGAAAAALLWVDPEPQDDPRPAGAQGAVSTSGGSTAEPGPGPSVPSSPEASGADLVAQNGCLACHTIEPGEPGILAPNLAGVANTNRTLVDGTRVLADAAYLRESIRDPRARVVAGFDTVVMPSFSTLRDSEVDAMVAYLDSLSELDPTAGEPTAAQSPTEEPPPVGQEATGATSVSLGNPDVRGSLSREVVRRVVTRHIGEIRRCYERALGTRPSLEGRVAISWVIGGTGAVTSASVASSTLGEGAAEECMVSRVRTWTFPAPEGGGVVGVRHPFVFARQGGSRAGSEEPSSRDTQEPSAGSSSEDRSAQVRACQMRGDNNCVIRLLEGNAHTENELATLIEAYRATGNRATATRHMRAYVQRYPAGRRSSAYRQILGSSDRPEPRADERPMPTNPF